MRKFKFAGEIQKAVTLGLFVVAALSAYGQVETGRLVGRVTDAQGAVVPQATVKATNVGTNIVQTAVSNSTGDYVITPVAAGVYKLSINAPGFQTSTTSNIEVHVGQIARMDIALKVGATTTTIEVTSSSPLLSTDSATIGTVVSNQQLTDLPLNGRGFYQLAELTPGAALLPATGNSLPIRPEIVNGNTISGVHGRATSFLLDGVDVSEQHQGGTFIQTSIDALQEFSVQQNAYSAEYNRGGPGFNATTKSGTNSIHGGVFEFIRNEKLDARNYFSLSRGILKRNQFGGDIGGPLTIGHLYSGKDRTFFFVDYEAQRLRQGLVESGTVPTRAQRIGDFSAAGLNPIYDPQSTTTVGGVTTRNQISCNGALNVICPGLISAQAKAILAYYPAGNASATRFEAVPSQAIDWDQFTIRIDHQINSRNHLFGRWAYVNNRETDPNFAPLLKTAALTSNGQDIAIGLITNIGNNKVQDFRIHGLPSHVRLAAFLEGPDFNAANGILGFTGLTRPDTGSSFPDYSFSGYAAMQGSTFDQRPKSQDRRALEPTDTFTILKGRQSLKFGVLIRYFQWLGYDSANYAGSFTFTGAETQNPGGSTKGGDAFADFLLGYPAAVSRAYPKANFGGQAWYKEFFAQDDIQVSGRLTVNIGLRYEYSPWMEGYLGQLGTFDPTQTKPIIVASHTSSVNTSSQYAAPNAMKFFGQYVQTTSDAGLPYNLTYTDKLQFAPRIGFAWRPFGNKTVIRGGFGMYYEPEGTDGRVNANILPFLLAETVNQTQNVVPNRTLANFFNGSLLGSALANPSINPTRTHLQAGEDDHYSLAVERELSSKTLFEVAYVANHGLHLQSGDDANDPTPGPGAIQGRRPYQPWGPISWESQDQGSTYESLQSKFQHRMGNGLSALVSYTWSKYLQFGQTPQVGGNLGYEHTYSPFDIPQNLAFSGTYMIPVGRGRQFMAKTNGVANAVLGGWQVQTITVLHSGTPYTPVVGSDVANTGVGGQRPNLSPAGGSTTFQKSLKKWFDSTRYVQAPQYTYGTVRGNTLRGDMRRQFDASFFKNFNLPGESMLSFRAEFFNISNTTSFNPPGATVTSSSCCAITSTSVPSRDIQFALKYDF
ncbi:MAG TPA: carboxypeptidase-like regulatory domain-containing protein [Terracidiphilus sp.]|nr:carboxypeptidase-like regulatory domain-containing protein [Terracidiphilus sp.]